MKLNLEQNTSQLPAYLRDLDPKILLSENYVVYDYETLSVSYGDPRDPDGDLVLAVWYLSPGHPNYDPSREFYWHFGNVYDQGRIIEDIERADIAIAHNAKFDHAWSIRAGLDPITTMAVCTMVSEYVIAGNRSGDTYGRPWRLALNECAKRRGWDGKEDLVSRLIKGGVCPSYIPKSWLLEYGIQDVRLCRDLWWSQRRTLLRLGLLPVCYARNLNTIPLIGIEAKGLHLNRERVEAEYTKYASKLQELETQFHLNYGGINWNSPPQLRELIYGTLKFKPLRDHNKQLVVTKAGKEARKADRSADMTAYLPTDGDTIDKLDAKTKRQKEFVELWHEIGKYRTAISKVLGKFQQCVEETDDAILYARFNQTKTGTHRFSSSGSSYAVQFQNINRDFKPCVSPRTPGWLFAEHDYAQLEFRVAVRLGEDEAGYDMLAHGSDAHAYSASIIFKEDWPTAVERKEAGDAALFKTLRQNAKSETFKPLYGGQSGTDRQMEYYKAFREKYAGITAWQNRNIQTCLEKGQFTTPTGLIFYFRDTRTTRTGYVINSTNICNYPVQMLATADIVPLAVVFAWYRMRIAGLESFINNTIHDSITGEVKPEEKELYDAIVCHAMETDSPDAIKRLYDFDLKVPLDAEGGDDAFGSAWGA